MSVNVTHATSDPTRISNRFLRLSERGKKMRPTRPRSKTQIAGQQLANYSSGRAALMESTRLVLQSAEEPAREEPSEAEIEFKEKVLGDLGK